MGEVMLLRGNVMVDNFTGENFIASGKPERGGSMTLEVWQEGVLDTVFNRAGDDKRKGLKSLNSILLKGEKL